MSKKLQSHLIYFSVKQDWSLGIHVMNSLTDNVVSSSCIDLNIFRFSDYFVLYCCQQRIFHSSHSQDHEELVTTVTGNPRRFSSIHHSSH